MFGDGYSGDGMIDPANTDAEAGRDEQDPSEAHPDTIFISNTVGSAAGQYFLLGLLLHGGIGLAIGASAMACTPPHNGHFRVWQPRHLRRLTEGRGSRGM